MIACGTAAVGAAAGGARIGAVTARTGGALVVVPRVLMVQMTVVDVVHVASMDHGGVAAARSMGVAVGLGGRVPGVSAHDNSFRTGAADCGLAGEAVPLHRL